jgi:hypothetical protein
MTMINDSLRDEINKRFTLNWLIQGAAQHAGMTLHHLVHDELDALNPKLLRLYDQFALVLLLQYWWTGSGLIFGSPDRFWKRARTDPRHPFFGHPLLSRYGGMLAAANRQRALARCKEKRFTCLPIHPVHRLRLLERPHRPKLVELARKSVSTIWGIPTERLDGDLAGDFNFGTPIKIRNFRARLVRSATVGLGGVVERDGSLIVMGRGLNWQLLASELVKGTAELICLHGLSRLSDDTYCRVVDTVDRIEYERWMLQTGGELWRRLLLVMPHHRRVADVLMCLARLPAKSLQALMQAVIEQPEWARELLANLRYESGSRIGE